MSVPGPARPGFRRAFHDGDKVRSNRVSIVRLDDSESLGDLAADIETCRHCGGRLSVIASIEDPALIERILAPFKRPAEQNTAAPFAARAPPQPSLL
jgi:hypothetical protein